MSFLVDTSVWSLAFRRDSPDAGPELRALRSALEQGESVVCTGLILQEVLQGFVGANARASLLQHFSAFSFVTPDRFDHIEAAELRNLCRRNGVQVGTIDALIAQLCIRHDLTLLSTNADFLHASHFCGLRNWTAP